MALVRVEDLHRHAERLECPNPTDAQEDLLSQPVFDVASVEAVGHELQLRAVLR